MTENESADSPVSERANRYWWDSDADSYHREHGSFIGTDSDHGEFIWCPEAMHEADFRLLDGWADKDILEVGCGSAPCGRWLAHHGAWVVAFDISSGMLRHASAEPGLTLLQASAEALPFADESFDIACSSFGAVPFVANSAHLMREVHRVLRPGGQWVYSVNHPMRWIFPDDPGPNGLTATMSYFSRTPYVERDAHGSIVYVEHHRTIGDRVREAVSAGLIIEDIVEPEWPETLTAEWGQWSPLRGAIFPGTAIFCTRKPAVLAD